MPENMSLERTELATSLCSFDFLLEYECPEEGNFNLHLYGLKAASGPGFNRIQAEGNPAPFQNGAIGPLRCRRTSMAVYGAELILVSTGAMEEAPLPATT